MKSIISFYGGLLLFLTFLIDITHPTCVLESDFGFKINCAFKKSGLFRVRNLGGLKAHASLGFSLGDELGFEQSLTNLDTSRRRSVNLKNAPPNIIIEEATGRSTGKQEKRGKQSRIMMRPPAPSSRPSQTAMDRLTSLHRRASSTMRPIIVIPTLETPTILTNFNPSVTMAKPLPMGVPPFKPLPPKEETMKVIPVSTMTRKAYSPLPVPQSKGPGLAYQSEKYPQISHDQISKMVSQMTASHVGLPIYRITPTPIIVNTPQYYSVPTTLHPFIPMPIAAPPTQAMSLLPSSFKNSIQSFPSKSSNSYNTLNIQKPLIPNSNFVDPVPHQVHDLASAYNAYNTKKADDYNSITGYGDDTALKFDKEDINAKIAEIAQAGNISMEAVEAAIALRQQQLLSKYANIQFPPSTTTTTTTTMAPALFQPEPEPEIIVNPPPSKPKRIPSSGKVMNAPREYYPVGYEKNFDDHFQSKVDLPDTNFNCGDQKYFPGLYGDENLGCMVFHVCALTDDGLVMKSFLCPESTLFDQTILKCNWWFYVDCKNTKKLYDTNIPVSKSYQLMKALTFFSSYNKELQENAGHTTNPEDVAGIKEALSMLESQDQTQSSIATFAPSVQVVTALPIIDERSRHKYDDNSTQQGPIYRGTRNFKDQSSKNLTKSSDKVQNTKEIFVTVKPSNQTVTTSAESTKSAEQITTTENPDKRYRRKMTLKNNSGTTKATTTVRPTEIAKPETITQPFEDPYQQLITEINNAAERQETLVDQLEENAKEPSDKLVEAANANPKKRFYRSSEEVKLEAKEIEFVNNEKVQIIRPTSEAKVVGELQTPTAAIAKLDEAILGKSKSVKREIPRLHLIRSPTNRDRT